MAGFITFDEYLLGEYVQRIEKIKQHARGFGKTLTDDDVARMTIPFPQFLGELQHMEGLFARTDLLNVHDLPSYVQRRMDGYTQKENTSSASVQRSLKHQNLELIELALGQIISMDNYGIGIFSPRNENLFDLVDSDFSKHPHLLETCIRSSAIISGTYGKWDDDLRREKRSEFLYRKFDRKKVGSGLRKKIWSEMTRLEQAEEQYHIHTTPCGDFGLKHFKDYPSNRVSIHPTGSYPHVLDLIFFLVSYCQGKGYLAHFHCDSKFEYDWPGVIFDPRIHIMYGVKKEDES